jgi:hypothetical protein
MKTRILKSKKDCYYRKPGHEGGKTFSENCQVLCKQDNRTKSGI